MDEAYGSGIPVVRPMILEFDKKILQNMVSQFMLGGDILVAGSQVFQSQNPSDTINSMQSL